MVKLNENLVECSCSNIMEVIPGEVQKGLKDDKGQLISAEAAKHMAKNRVRCHNCGKNFCV